MDRRPITFFLSFLFLSLFLSACRMTEQQIRSIPPEMLGGKNEMASNIEKEADSPKRFPLGIILAGLALIGGAFIYLKSDEKTIGILIKSVTTRKKSKPLLRQSKSRKKR